MLEMINFVFPITASMASSFRWGSYSDSADYGCLEKVTSTQAMGMVLTNCGVILDGGILGFWCEL